MIDPQHPQDLGRRVLKTDFIGENPRAGTVTNWTPDWVHVKFEGENFSRPEFREALDWEDEYLARYR